MAGTADEQNESHIDLPVGDSTIEYDNVDEPSTVEYHVRGSSGPGVLHGTSDPGVLRGPTDPGFVLDVLDSKEARHFLSNLDCARPGEVKDSPEKFLSVAGPWCVGHRFYMRLQDGHCILAATVSGLLTEQDVIDYWPLVDAADKAEIASFVKEKVFKLIFHSQADQWPIDAVWVRRWKGNQVKSRLCIRGFLDPQKHLVLSLIHI